METSGWWNEKGKWMVVWSSASYRGKNKYFRCGYKRKIEYHMKNIWKIEDKQTQNEMKEGGD